MSTLLLSAILASSPARADAAQTFQAMCATCHGPKGHGDGAAAAALPVKPANFADPAFWQERDDARVKQAITQGGASVGRSPLMAPFGSSLTPEQIDGLVAYLHTLSKG